ncbi:D-aminoacyl-tRNA deacylase [Tepidiforma thermophila]|uniref:D-aminoacyl-tRNA deacylase n=1 Tax=Tepidiforma thermophila (strain KCTC 52669 / CGMCC 1.13589 / G233) TaxID=2761530 RepID=A0A2A9HH68_TEPT2|nr:D-aminoacyl-tRNA deacylase [Tepidiforma thermophila]PFG74440.1 D-tyrosyl-tRNA(Tyr) deacylase [Tepidiforma thermophila]
MRAVIQRVRRAAVSVAGEQVASIGPGMVVLLGIARHDDAATAARLAGRVTGLRIFDDGAGHMNLDLASIGGAVLCISQFTLYGDVRRGRRPSFEAAAPAEQARPLYEAFVAAIRAAGIPCETGVFGAEMQVELVNDGPVTLIVDSADLERPRRA